MLTVAYDGTSYLGWQKTGLGGSVEEILQGVIEKILQHSAPLQAASRTDAGVHARGQVINFLTSKAKLDLGVLRLSLNRLLPREITILSADEMPISFHPTLDCTGKEYRYFTCCGQTQIPFHRNFSWHVPHALDLEKINQAIPSFIGTHDFETFCNLKSSTHYTHTTRTIQSLDLVELPENRLSFHIRGNQFLYRMVRNIVGTLIDVGRKRIPPDAIPSIIEARQRSEAGVTAPAHGLFLHRIFY